MRVLFPDAVVRSMVKQGCDKTDAMAVSIAANNFPGTLQEDGSVRIDAMGTTIIGRVDRTGNFLTVCRVKVDKRP